MKYLIDSSAWISYLEGSHKGEFVNNILKGGNEIFTIPLIVAEVVSKIKRQKANAEVAYEAILSNSYVAEITPKTAKEAGLLHAELKNKIQGIGLADSLILCSSRALSAKIITEDAHFKSFKEAIVL